MRSTASWRMENMRFATAATGCHLCCSPRWPIFSWSPVVAVIRFGPCCSYSDSGHAIGCAKPSLVAELKTDCWISARLVDCWIFAGLATFLSAVSGLFMVYSWYDRLARLVIVMDRERTRFWQQISLYYSNILVELYSLLSINFANSLAYYCICRESYDKTKIAESLLICQQQKQVMEGNINSFRLRVFLQNVILIFFR